MEWTHILGLIFGNLAVILPLWLWNRAESRADIRHMETSQRNMEAWLKGTLDGIREEMKDFHGRLCAIEERNKK